MIGVKVAAVLARIAQAGETLTHGNELIIDPAV